jgi:hypothetical protein
MPTASDMLEAIDSCLRLDEDFQLTEWEEKFVISITRLVKTGRTLSQAQATRLEAIYDRT